MKRNSLTYPIETDILLPDNRTAVILCQNQAVKGLEHLNRSSIVNPTTACLLEEKMKSEKERKWQKEYRKKYKKSNMGRFERIRERAKVRGIEFNLTFKEFCRYKDQPCFYCGKRLDKIRLDRVDNNKDYSLNNCVSCCYNCNKHKFTMPIEEFLERHPRIKEGIYNDMNDKETRLKYGRIYSKKYRRKQKC